MAAQSTTQNGNKQAVVKAPDPQNTLKAALANIRGTLSEVLPKHLPPERLIKVVLSCTARNRDLLKCTTASIVRCVMQGAELGLEVGGLLGEAYLVPFKNKHNNGALEAQLIIGYQGLLKLARQSGDVKSIVSRVVRKGEQIEIDLANNSVKHLFSFDGETDAPMIGVYALMTLTNGERILEVMTKTEVDLVKARAAADDGPWVTDYEPMARKTVLRRVCKYGPKSTERFRDVVEAEEFAHGRTPDDVPPPQFATGPRAAALLDAVAERAAAFSGFDPETGEVLDAAGDLVPVGAEPVKDPAGT